MMKENKFSTEILELRRRFSENVEFELLSDELLQMSDAQLLSGSDGFDLSKLPFSSMPQHKVDCWK